MASAGAFPLTWSLKLASVRTNFPQPVALEEWTDAEGEDNDQKSKVFR